MATPPNGHSSRQRISAGTRLNGIYEIDDLIGIGGMGEIYRGHTIETGDPVAIKLMLPELAENEAALALFRKEASALHHLMHDAIVRYYVFTVEPVLHRPYLAMEFVNGRSVSELLEIDGPLPFEAVRSLMQRVASGLQAAHERGIIHRDVSPDNIIVPGGDVARAKIIDFGIARSTQLSQGTVIGSGFAGKFNYVSPEQLGMFGGNVTAKSDIYSLGLVLVQSLTGQPIDMGGSQVQVVDKRRRVPDLGAIDMRIRPLIERMLQPDPADRPESMAAVAAWPVGSPAAQRRRSDASRSPTGRATGDTRKRGGWRYVTAALLVLILAGAGSSYYYFGGELWPTPSPPSINIPDLKPGPIPSIPDRPQPPQPPQPNVDDLVRPPVPPPVPPIAPVERIRQYLERYDGGDCFFIVPIAIGEKHAAIEGLGASLQPFNKFDDAFKRDIGFSPDIGLRQVTQQQCPAVTFLGRLKQDRTRAPRLGIDKVRIKGGDVISGTIDRFGSRNVELLLVADNGTVQNVSNLLKPGIDAKTFNIGLQASGDATGSQPQLLLAVATAQPLAALRPAQPAAGQQLFPAVLEEASRTRQTLSVDAKYFRLER